MADDYLRLVEGWNDPYPEPVVEPIGENVFVVRDDLLQYGSKIRFLDYYVSTIKADELVYGSSPAYGYAKISLGYLCKKYNKKAVIFEAARKQLHPYQQRAVDLGVDLRMVPMGFLAVTEARAREYSSNRNRILLPMGLEHDTAFGSILKVCHYLPNVQNLKHIWVASSSGTIARGLKLAFPKAEVHCVSVGHSMSDRELGNNTLHLSPYKFSQEIKKKEAPPYPSASNYDAKVWPVLQAYLKENSSNDKHLVWNVGS